MLSSTSNKFYLEFCGYSKCHGSNTLTTDAISLYIKYFVSCHEVRLAWKDLFSRDSISLETEACPVACDLNLWFSAHNPQSAKIIYYLVTMNHPRGQVNNNDSIKWLPVFVVYLKGGHAVDLNGIEISMPNPVLTPFILASTASHNISSRAIGDDPRKIVVT